MITTALNPKYCVLVAAAIATDTKGVACTFVHATPSSHTVPAYVKHAMKHGDNLKPSIQPSRRVRFMRSIASKAAAGKRA